ncbi:hypothetical protein PRIPAC_78210 [Pristionchus pacificus]|uniref:Uncharacterized protein n=1 Tax=Pristionchus pacificus TaxID=54126 RepID=A0A2A6BH60_PRIPA|nr:hypothetical protein PRIPAC_78210 [Pristionchus pacificus]|eukprot:PDM65166.1 hypothetical protein PRIPAC_52108 [Pristionchus pacificus]
MINNPLNQSIIHTGPTCTVTHIHRYSTGTKPPIHRSVHTTMLIREIAIETERGDKTGYEIAWNEMCVWGTRSETRNTGSGDGKCRSLQDCTRLEMTRKQLLYWLVREWKRVRPGESAGASRGDAPNDVVPPG